MHHLGADKGTKNGDTLQYQYSNMAGKSTISMFFPLKPPFGLGRFDYWRVLPSNTNTPRGGQDDRDQILGIGPLATAAQDQSSGHETPLKEK